MELVILIKDTVKHLKKHILYLDMNSLYGHAMSQCLPYPSFKWVKDVNRMEQKLMNLRSNSSTEYILQVSTKMARYSK